MFNRSQSNGQTLRFHLKTQVKTTYIDSVSERAKN